jgi:hypothetical protein
MLQNTEMHYKNASQSVFNQTLNFCFSAMQQFLPQAGVLSRCTTLIVPVETMSATNSDPPSVEQRDPQYFGYYAQLQHQAGHLMLGNSTRLPRNSNS